MTKNYNKLAILSLIFLICSILVLVVVFPLFDKIFDKVYYNYKLQSFLGEKFKYIDFLLDILPGFLLITFHLFLLASVTTGIISLFRIKKTKEKGEIIATLSMAISALWFFGSFYVGWGLW